MSNEPNKKAVGQRIKEIRNKKGESLEKFGLRFNPPANRSLVSAWENGRYLPNNERLKKLAEIGGLTVDELLYGIPEINMTAKVYLINEFGPYVDNKKDVVNQERMLLTDSAFEGLLRLIGQGKGMGDKAVERYEVHRSRIEDLIDFGETYINKYFNNYNYSNYLKEFPDSDPKGFQKNLEYQWDIFKELLDNFWESADIVTEYDHWINKRFTNQIRKELNEISKLAVEEDKEHYYVNEVVQPFLDQAAKDFKEYIKDYIDTED